MHLWVCVCMWCRGWKLTLGAISQSLGCFETVSLTGPWNFQIRHGSLVSKLRGLSAFIFPMLELQVCVTILGLIGCF